MSGPPAVIVIDLDPNVAHVGGLLITWHGIFSVLGILGAWRLGQYLAWRYDRIAPSRISDVAVWMVIVGLIGARLLFVWENYKQFVGQWVHVLYINEGGISQWGGLFGAIAGAYIWCRRNGESFWKVIDAGGPGALIGLAIGRIGDIINGEHHGTPTNLPWGVEYVNPSTLGEPGKVVHPEVAYELLLCLGLLAVLLPFHGRLKARLPAGATGLLYLALYAAGRFLLSFMRTDSLVLGLRQAQWASLAMVVFAAVAIAVMLRMRRTAPVPVAVQAD
jgi:phosphatidylglycerol:prolipoprotein diacylglycerol transferase